MSISTNLNGVTQLGSWTFTLGGAIPAGANIIGAVTQAGAWTMGLPTNAAQESGGNLAYLTRLVEVTTLMLAELRALRLQQGAAYGNTVDPSHVIDDFSFN